VLPYIACVFRSMESQRKFSSLMKLKINVLKYRQIDTCLRCILHFKRRKHRENLSSVFDRLKAHNPNKDTIQARGNFR
jgi:hypothetical protein